MGKELFDNIPSKVADLLSDVKNGRIGLPDLQRPFVWKDNKVRELLDSMMKGYPIGYIMLWASPDDYENTGYIGKNDKMYKRPDDLVIDGQQRLTALLAAMYGVTIKDKNYKERKIRISFNPLTREFAVWTQAFEKIQSGLVKSVACLRQTKNTIFPSLEKHISKLLTKVVQRITSLS